MTADPFDLERFVKAQEHSYATALDEDTNGRKQSHWVWFILPQLRGLGHSERAHKFGISGMAEAQAYMAHPLLGLRLVGSPCHPEPWLLELRHVGSPHHLEPWPQGLMGIEYQLWASFHLLAMNCLQLIPFPARYLV